MKIATRANPNPCQPDIGIHTWPIRTGPYGVHKIARDPAEPCQCRATTWGQYHPEDHR